MNRLQELQLCHEWDMLPVRAFRVEAGRLCSLEKGGKGGSSAPPPPDYVGAANATAAGNKEAALTTGAMNRPTQVGPTGTVSWQLKPGADPNNPHPGDWIQTTALTQPQQQLLDADTNNQLQLSTLAGQGIASAGKVLGTTYTGANLPAKAGDINTDPNRYAAERQQVQDAIYRRGTQYYDDRYGKQEAALKTELANKGLTEGSEAYKNAMLQFTQDRDTAYADATDRAIAAGGQEQSRIQSDLINALQQQQNRRNNQLQEDITIRDLPLNEINALQSGTQVSMPQFSTFMQQQGYAGPDILGATSGQYSAQSAANAAQMAAKNQQMGTYGNLAAAALMAYA